MVCWRRWDRPFQHDAIEPGHRWARGRSGPGQPFYQHRDERERIFPLGRGYDFELRRTERWGPAGANLILRQTGLPRPCPEVRSANDALELASFFVIQIRAPQGGFGIDQRNRGRLPAEFRRRMT